jgi:hypothetical protein
VVRERTSCLFFELRSGYPTLPNNRQKRADRKLAVIWDRNGDAARVGLPLHHDVTSASADFDEAMLLENPTDLASRKDAKPTHA